ncbi:hypothetical protein P170DRAFT_506072 [Aspergillus steynii IBT 23096]|uniref:Uncharacterized protein n=1 Tax=Aspergillus steynii IBT 23096 TaxID=1392250 RepID=A0A2I2GRG9_9EURO|nr:uncharacterized protein P170DRAFT_506072 [Aspergillus steynii IBT 23096]PLB55480.1 hypothetical protein P170DRAFT_506072 [Aspergillus steynii IBT 23096]
MYQRSHQSEQHTKLASLSLAKFSHTTTSASHRGPLHWNHIIGNGDIVGVFERFTVSGNVLLKVFQDDQIIEQISITDLAQIAASEAQSSNPGSSKPTFAVVVKLPCLAIKYSTGNTHIRRFQIKFSLDRDYYTVLAILSDIKCPFSEPNIDPMPLTRRPSTAQWQMASSSSAMGGRVGGNLAPEQYASHGAFIQPHESTLGVSGTTSSITAAQTSLPSSSSTMPNVPAESWPNDRNRSGPRDTNISQDIAPRDPIPGQSNNALIRRPSTATTCYDAKSLETILPPKRQLPFLNPGPQEANKRPTTSSGHIFRKPEHTNLSGLSKPTNTSITPSTGSGSLPFPPPNNEKHHQSMNTEPVQNKPSQQESLDIQNPHLRSENLSAYVSSSTEERTKSLANWICQQIEDEKFVQLVQDMDGTWERLALGK